MTGEKEEWLPGGMFLWPAVWDRRPGDAWRSAVGASKSCEGRRAYQHPWYILNTVKGGSG